MFNFHPISWSGHMQKSSRDCYGGANWMGTFTFPNLVTPQSYTITCSRLAIAIRWAYMTTTRKKPNGKKGWSLAKRRTTSILRLDGTNGQLLLSVVWYLHYCISATLDVMWQCQEASVGLDIVGTTVSSRAATFWLECCLNNKPHAQGWRQQAKQ